MPWPKYPVIYEINTWVWLQELTRRFQFQVTLETVPAEEWDRLGALGVDAVWLMGVWERSPEGTLIARQLPGLLAEYQKALPDFTLQDIVGSPYCIRQYYVDSRLGGTTGLAVAREKLAQHGLLLLLDFVPNHVALDHPWVLQHPEYFIQGSHDDLRASSSEFFEAGGQVIACGRDPHFPPWTDTAQLNAFSTGLRQAASATLRSIAGQCDGVRCDMAMLLINRIFEGTWKERAGKCPTTEYWHEVILAVRRQFPDFLFIAEAYWDLEWDLQQQGFDYCYDKRLYDRLVHDTADNVRLHLLAAPDYQGRLLRFIENHDEPRAAAAFVGAQSRAAALIIGTLPGARLFHEGQLEGRRTQLPVQLGRRPIEPEDKELHAFYFRLFKLIHGTVFHDGEWQLCERGGWPDNQSYLNLVPWCWKYLEERFLIVANLSASSVQGRVRLPWPELSGRSWHLIDLFSGEVYLRNGNELHNPGLYAGLGPWGFHFLRFEA